MDRVKRIHRANTSGAVPIAPVPSVPVKIIRRATPQVIPIAASESKIVSKPKQPAPAPSRVIPSIPIHVESTLDEIDVLDILGGFVSPPPPIPETDIMKPSPPPLVPITDGPTEKEDDMPAAVGGDIKVEVKTSRDLDTIKVPAPFGLINQVSNCYFNALLQALMSCKYFVKHLYEVDSDITKLFREMIEGSDGSKSVEILKLAGPKLMTGQQCALEGFDVLIAAMKFESVFDYDYRLKLSCPKCWHVWTSSGIDKGLHFPEFDKALTDSYLSKSISDAEFKKAIIDDLFEHKSKAPGAKCEKCGHVDLIQLYELQSVGDILVLVFNKYDPTKPNLPFPDEIKLPASGGGDHTFKPVAVIEQSGSLSGGHYIAIVKRSTIHNCNDMSITPAMRLTSSPNTYIVFYEKQ